jgi:hypothetical protein
MNGSVLNTLFLEPVLLPAGGAIAALLFVLSVFVLRRAGPGSVRLLLPIGGLAVLVLAAVFLFERMRESEQAAERRALDQRALALAVQAAAPGSMLGCLDSVAGDAVENACESAVFADPQNVAAAVAYVSAKLALLADGVAYARKTDASFAERLSDVQRSVELDRFGIAAHVLSIRDGCTAERCPAFALLRETGALKANLRVHAYSEYVARHAAAWNSGSPAADKQPPVANSTPHGAPAVVDLPVPASPANPVPSRYDFPSAASIPPVSIMNAEPPLPAAAAAANAAAPPSETPPTVPMPPPRPQPQAPQTQAPQ